jgi:hypothetical protein
MTAGRGAEDPEFSPDFQDFIDLLHEHDGEAVLVGGYALGVHGVIRATGDIDFLYHRTKKNVQRLMAAMREFGAPPEVVDADALMSADTVSQFGEPPHRIDLLSGIDGVTYSEVSKGAVAAKVGGRTLRVIGLAELLKNKTAAGRDEDEDDLRRLRARARRT